MIGTLMPAILPPRFIRPPRKPILLRVASIDGTDQNRPHQRRKKRVEESSATTATASVT
ncbi:hypothetical protein D3C72_2580570 [compost metagenome]